MGFVQEYLWFVLWPQTSTSLKTLALSLQFPLTPPFLQGDSCSLSDSAQGSATSWMHPGWSRSLLWGHSSLSWFLLAHLLLHNEISCFLSSHTTLCSYRQDQPHNLCSSIQNENVGPLIKKLSISNNSSRALNHVWGHEATMLVKTDLLMGHKLCHGLCHVPRAWPETWYPAGIQ